MPISMTYQAFDANGVKVDGDLEVANEAEAYSKLTSEGMIPIRIDRNSGQTSRGHGKLRSRRRNSKFESTKNVLEMILPLSELLSAGFSVRAALDTLASQDKGHIVEIAKQLIGQINDGKSISVAFHNLTPSYPVDLIAIIEHGQASNRLPEALFNYVEIEQSKLMLKSDIGSSFIYPAFILSIAICIITIISFTLATSLVDLFVQEGRNPPFLLSGMAGYATFVSSPLFLVFSISLFGIFLAGMFFRHSNSVRRIRSTLYRFPIIGKIVLDWELAKILGNMGLLLKHGVPMPKVLANASSVADSSLLSESISKIETDVKNGARLSAAFASHANFPELVIQGILIGEKSNTLPVTCERMAKLYALNAQRTGQKFSAVLTPALTIIVGILVGAVVLTTMKALLAINELVL